MIADEMDITGKATGTGTVRTATFRLVLYKLAMLGPSILDLEEVWYTMIKAK